MGSSQMSPQLSWTVEGDMRAKCTLIGPVGAVGVHTGNVMIEIGLSIVRAEAFKALERK